MRIVVVGGGSWGTAFASCSTTMDTTSRWPAGTPPRCVLGSVVEGFTTAPALARLAQRHGVEMPITDGVCNVLQKNGGPRELVSTLMGRQPTEE